MARTAFLHPFARPLNDDYLTIVRGRGALVWDSDGREYVDGLASLWYCNVGHGREEVADAVAAQMRRLAGYHTFERFTNEPAERLCATLAELAPFPDARVFLTSSGSEAVDSAIKIARLAHALNGESGRTIVVSRIPSYHGVTYGGMSATGLPLNHEHFGPVLPDVLRVPYDDLEATRQVFEQHPGRIAALLAEPVIGAGGVYPPPHGYLEGLRTLCDEHGAFLVFDEVVCGFGRLGHWWGAQRFGVTPDLVTFAKGVTAGYLPLGGVLVGAAVRSRLEADPTTVLRHGHTYSGHPSACVAAETVLGILQREQLLDRAVPVGQRLSAGLRDLVDGGRIVEVRGDGAVWAVGFGEGVNALDVRERMLTLGVIPRPIGTSAIAFAPPLVITDEQIDRCIEAVAKAVA